MTLHLGVIDVPYAEENGITTGDVADILEAKYHPMEIFYELHKQEIADDITNGVQNALEALMMGAPDQGLTGAVNAGTTNINEKFKDFLANGEMESLGYPGVPTQAALDGVNHRLKKKSGPRRPSFIDTGLYQSSFTSWVDGE